MHGSRHIVNVQLFRYSLLLFLSLTAAAFCAHSQKLNNPNKQGPLGIQVNTLSGNIFIPRTDMYIPARGFDLDISFHYNSFLFTEDAGYGKGWTFHYNIRYSHDTAVAGARKLHWGDGREDRYDSLPGGAYRSPRGFFNTLSQYQPGKYVLTETDGLKYFFDAPDHKRITRMEEPNGNFIEFTYTDSLLTSLSNGAGHVITFTYTPEKRLATVTDANATPARVFTYTYENGGNLREVTNPLGGKYKYTYLVNGPMKSMADRNSNKVDIIYYSDLTARELVGCNKRVSFSYDTALQTTVVTDHLETGNQVTKYKYKTVADRSWITSVSGNCCGFNLKYEYDSLGNRTKVTDANNQVYNYTYDTFGNVLTATDPLGGVSTYTYTPDFKKISSVRDPKGNLYTLSYDIKGNLTQLVTPGNNVYSAAYNAQGDIISSTDPRGQTYTYNYDAWGNPTHVTGPAGYTATLVFDARGNLLSYTDARGNQATAEYDILNRLKKITDPLNQFSQLNYDAEGNIVSVTNRNNEISLLNYDASGRLVKTTGPTGNEISFAFDGMDNLLSVKNALGHEIKMSYDSRNRLKSAKDPDGNQVVYTYDGNGNVTTATWPNGRVISFRYDGLNRLTDLSDATGQIAGFQYDRNGNITRYTNAAGAVTTAVYDSLNRMTEITDPLGNKRFLAYDRNDNIITITDAEGRSRHYTYDSLDRVKTYTDNNGFVISVGYDPQNNIVSLTDQNNNTTTYTYDSLNRRKRMTFPDGKYKEYTYDREGNLTALRLTDAGIITYQYDTLNRVVSRTLPGGETFSYTYDKLNRVLTATNSNGTVSFTYDRLNRVTSETFDVRTTRYSYNVSGRTHTTIYPDSSVVVKEYDTRNRLIKVMKDSVLLAEYAYNNANQLTQKTFANGVSTVMQYDFASRLSSLQTVAASGTLQHIQFSYDKEYNKTAINRLNNPSRSEQFTYDNGYRLTHYKRGPVGSPVLQNSYTYDPVGNRISASLNGAPTSYSVNNLNQITAVNATNFVYDDRGNLVFDGFFYKTYDAENRLLKDSSSPAGVVSYGYDALNRRVRKTVNGNTFKYTYGGFAQLEERDGANQLLNRTVYNHFLSPVMNERSGEKYFYHANELGSVEAITGATGRLVEAYQYDVYGKPARLDSLNNPLASSVAGNRFGFTGQEYDSASGSYRFFFRNYSSETGVFNQRDLIEYGDGMSMYQYVGNNPANGVDPWGLYELGESEVLDYNYDPANSINLVDEIKWNFYTAWVTRQDECGSVNRTQIGFFVSAGGASNWFADKGSNERLRQLRQRGPGSKVRRMARNGDLSAKAKMTNHNIKVGRTSNFAKGAKVLGNGIGIIDVAVKGEAYLSSLQDGISPFGAEEVQAGADLALSGLGFTGVGAVYGIADFGVEFFTGKGITSHTADFGGFLGDITVTDGEDIESAAYEYAYSQGNASKWIVAQRRMEERQKRWRESRDCNEGGSNRQGRWVWSLTRNMYVFIPFDPNLILGPAGQPDQAWVSVKDRLPYTILFENDSNATARARFVRITTPIEPKQDPATLELGSVGFNNQSFDLPPGRASYYQRLDARDSTGVYVDLTAGYDVFRNEIFWEFQAIDPLTLLPPEDPLAGFLFLHDSTQAAYGNGFVNFSLKPRSDAQTLDTISARAFIIFDENEVIPTNVHKNTIDALPPVSQVQAITGNSTNPLTLSWSGADDPGGCGIDYYTVYVTTDQVNYSVLFPRISRTDTTFSLPTGFNYCFFVLATDRVGNTEALRPGVTTCTSVGNPLPVTWLYFNGTNQGKNNILRWATASEQNSREFRLERSLNGSDFTQIAVIPAAGNSVTERRYSYTDPRIDLLNSRVMFYRLKQVDLDGRSRYSTIVRLTYSQDGKTPSIVYPNPTKGFVNILAGDKTVIGKEAIISDINGRILRRIVISAANQQVDLSPYASGLYLIRLPNDEVLRVMKQ